MARSFFVSVRKCRRSSSGGEAVEVRGVVGGFADEVRGKDGGFRDGDGVEGKPDVGGR